MDHDTVVIVPMSNTVANVAAGESLTAHWYEINLVTVKLYDPWTKKQKFKGQCFYLILNVN
jgi:hypothetical protein